MFFRFLTLVLAMLLAAPAVAQGGQRIALVVGNSGYNAQVGPLANPGRDADLIAQSLTARGFKVTVVKNTSRVELLTAIDRYAAALGRAGPSAIGFFYYSGHGVANPDTKRNYIVPIDAASAADARLWYESVPLDDVVRTISTAAQGASNLIVFDACRDQLALPRERSLGGAKGLVRTEALDSTLIAYSTAPGRTAADRDATALTGPYATELAQHLASDGVDVITMFENVKFGVLQRTGRKQQPWVENGLAERLYLGAANGGSSTAATPLPAPAATFAASKPAAAAGKAPNYAKWGLTERDMSTMLGADLVRKAGGSARLPELRTAAAAGDAVAAVLAGIIYYDGIGVTKDYATGADLFRDAAQTGLPRGMANYGLAFEAGMGGLPRDPAQAMQWYRRAADAGNGKGMAQVGYLYANGSGVEKSPTEALRWYRRAADAGNTMAMTQIGSSYLEGLGVAKDDVQALQWYRRAADAGSSGGMYSVGWMYHQGRGVTADYSEAMRWFLRAADANDADAMHEIATFYYLGQGVGKDDTQAMKWSRRAAELGNAASMGNVGFFYENGVGVGKDYGQALQWYRRGADAGDAGAMRGVGWLYAKGYGVAKDDAQAVQWFRRSAEAGDTTAMSNLGSIYAKGVGVTMDYEQAMSWYRKAADANNAAGMAGVAWLQESGFGVTKNLTEAISWYRKAAALKHDGAIAALKRLNVPQ